ncbi:hypothetical protein AB0932_35830 [Streptomyces sp. NPDC006682]
MHTYKDGKIIEKRYGTVLRTALDKVAEAISRRNAVKRHGSETD